MTANLLEGISEGKRAMRITNVVRSAAAAIGVSFISVAAIAAGAPPTTASGVWQQIDDETGVIGALITISEHNGRYEGRITKLFLKPGDPVNPICSACSGDRKDKPYLGLQIIDNLERHGLEYDGGTILNPQDGAEYSVTLALSPDGQTLTVRGYIGISLLGRSQEWKRLT